MKTSGTPAIEVIGSPTLRGGIVLVDDGAACSGPNNYVLNVGTGNSNGHVTSAVNGDIYLKAQNGLCTGSACDASQVDAATCWNADPALTTCTGYSPAPLPLTVTLNRSRIDYLYNCRSGYTTGTGNYINVTIDGSVMANCPDTAADYINTLYNSVVVAGGLEPDLTLAIVRGTDKNTACDPTWYSAAPAVTLGPIDFNCKLPNNLDLVIGGDVRFRQTNYTPGTVVVNGSARFDGDLTPVNLTVNGNAVVGGNVSLGSGNALEIAGNSYFLGNIALSGNALGGGLLKLHGSPGGSPCTSATFITSIDSCVRQSGYSTGSPSAGAAFSFMNGSFSQNGGTALIDRVMVFGTASGLLDRSGGGAMTWTPPTLGPFTKLSMWSDSTGTHKMGGGGDLAVEGTFFSPNAIFELGGNNTTLPLKSSFWALKLQAAGTATFRLQPDPTLISAPVGPSVRLIR